MIFKKSFDVVNAAHTDCMIGRCSRSKEYRHTGDVSTTCFLCFVQHGGWFSENVCEIILA